VASPVARFPFVSKADILRAYRPGAEPSERTFQTLRKRGLVSKGVAVRPRQRGRVVGQLRCYAALNVDAVLLARHERTDEAAEVAGQAGRFETEWEPLLAELAVTFELQDYEALRAARNLLAHSLAPATEQLERLHRECTVAVAGLVSEEFVRIGEINQHWAALQVVNPRLADTLADTFKPLNDALAAIARSFPRLDPGISATVIAAFEPLERARRQLAIDPFLPHAANLTTGDLAVLRIEHSAGSSLLSLLAAVQEGEPFVLDDEAAPYFSDEPLPARVIAQVANRRRTDKAVVVPALTVPLAS
jgi:hypothetical protein